MRSSLPPTDPRIERSRPLLGTTVAIRVQGLEPALAHAAIDDAFTVVADIHARMSFHEETSDVGRLNREAHLHPVAVDRHTFAVLRLALEFAEASAGVFDITIAPGLVDRDFLPSPENAPHPDASATSFDIELLPDNRVRFRKPLWVDLGGIAKGYAVDRAMECLIARGVTQASVNAGGDLRVHGPLAEQVLLTPDTYRDGVPVIELENGSIASSGALAHVDGNTRRPAEGNTFASVVADDCVVTDAMTKVVIAAGRAAAPLLARYGAMAHLYNPRTGWQHFGAVPASPATQVRLAS